MTQLPAENEPPVLDVATAERLLQLQRTVANVGENVLAELAQIFERDAARYVDGIREALSENDPEGARRALHALKGASLSVGAHRVSILVGALEQHTKDHGVDALADLSRETPRLALEIPRALEALYALAHS